MIEIITFIMLIMFVSLVSMLLLGINPIEPIRQQLICIDYHFGNTTGISPLECFK